MKISRYTHYNAEEVLALYRSVGWSNYYERPDMLERAYANSLYTLGAYLDDTLVGIIRVVGDGASIVYVQDIIVIPDYQRRGIGTALMNAILEKYRDTYQIILATDNSEKTAAFYRSLGFISMEEMDCVAFQYSGE